MCINVYVYVHVHVYVYVYVYGGFRKSKGRSCLRWSYGIYEMPTAVTGALEHRRGPRNGVRAEWLMSWMAIANELKWQ